MRAFVLARVCVCVHRGEGGVRQELKVDIEGPDRTGRCAVALGL